MKIQWKKLFACLAIPLAVGGLSALLTRKGMEFFQTLQQPPLSPPGWLFPIVWSILYILMGIASYLVLTSGKQDHITLTIYGIQLFFNFLWSILFFNFRQYLPAFIWLVILWLLISACIILFYRISKPAAYLMVPYLFWVTFAGYLNFGVYFLN